MFRFARWSRKNPVFGPASTSTRNRTPSVSISSRGGPEPRTGPLRSSSPSSRRPPPSDRSYTRRGEKTRSSESSICPRTLSIPAVRICTERTPPYRSTTRPGRESPSEYTTRRACSPPIPDAARRAKASRIRDSMNPAEGSASPRETRRSARRAPRFAVAVPRRSPDRERTRTHWPGGIPSGTSRRSSPNTQGWPDRRRSSPFRLTRTAGRGAIIRGAGGKGAARSPGNPRTPPPPGGGRAG
jgi:hypothetical protein